MSLANREGSIYAEARTIGLLIGPRTGPETEARLQRAAAEVGVALIVLRVDVAGEVRGACSPVRKGNTAEIASDILKRRPYRIDSLPLDEGHGVIEIIDTIKRRKAPDRELAI